MAGRATIRGKDGLSWLVLEFYMRGVHECAVCPSLFGDMSSWYTFSACVWELQVSICLTVRALGSN